MALNNNSIPRTKGVQIKPFVLQADDSETTINTVPAGASVVEVTGVTNNADDFIVLPRLGEVQNGHEMTILCSAGANFEIRTPATSAEEINSEDCDGTIE